LTRSQVRRITVATLVALVGLSGTTALGFWQYSRAHRDDISRQVLAAPAVPVGSLVSPGGYVPEAAFGHLVTAQGFIDRAQALATCGRAQAGQPEGCWLLAPAFLGSDPLAVTVVMGFVPQAQFERHLGALRALGPGKHEVLGRMQPGELIDKGKALLRPSDTVASININELTMRWETDLLDGYLVAERGGSGTPVTAPLILPPSGITWRNLIYAWQWWAFAAFVLFLLGRYAIDVRNETASTRLDPRATSDKDPT
jgi:cytochrome oxidase assembly protein ShyY1